MSAREVYLAADPVNAEIAKDVLVNHGIAAHVRSQHLWGGMGELREGARGALRLRPGRACIAKGCLVSRGHVCVAGFARDLCKS